MNFGTMRTEVRERLGEATPNFWPTAAIDRWLNEGVRQFCREEDWSWLLTIQRNIPVGAGVGSIELIDNVTPNRHFNMRLWKAGDTTPVTPTRVSPVEGFNLEGHLTTNGTPQFWYVSTTAVNDYGAGDVALANVVTLIPSPDVAYTAEYMYTREPSELTADASEADVPPAYREAVVAWATGVAWLKELSGGNKAQEQFSLYASVVDKAKRDERKLSADSRLKWGGNANLPRRTSLRLPKHIGL